MAKVVINKEKCKGCMLCVSVCNSGLITADNKLNRKGVAAVKFNDNNKCKGCMFCAIICPDCCIEVYK